MFANIFGGGIGWFEKHLRFQCYQHLRFHSFQLLRYQYFQRLRFECFQRLRFHSFQRLRYQYFQRLRFECFQRLRLQSHFIGFYRSLPVHFNLVHFNLVLSLCKSRHQMTRNPEIFSKPPRYYGCLRRLIYVRRASQSVPRVGILSENVSAVYMQYGTPNGRNLSFFISWSDQEIITWLTKKPSWMRATRADVSRKRIHPAETEYIPAELCWWESYYTTVLRTRNWKIAPWCFVVRAPGSSAIARNIAHLIILSEHYLRIYMENLPMEPCLRQIMVGRKTHPCSSIISHAHNGRMQAFKKEPPVPRGFFSRVPLLRARTCDKSSTDIAWVRLHWRRDEIFLY